MEEVLTVKFLTLTFVLAIVFLYPAARSELNDLSSHVPSKLEEIPIFLPKSWPTVDPTYVPDNISAEVVEGSEEVVKRLRARTGYLWPRRTAHDFHNYERRHAGVATTKYCEYEGRYVRKGAQKYIPEFDKVVVCRNVDPLWISVYTCNVLQKTPEKYKDLTPRLTSVCVKLCEKKSGANTKAPVGLPDWAVRMNNVSQRLKTEIFSTVSNRFYRRLKPLNPSSPSTRRRSRTATTQTAWDGEWDPEWDELRTRSVTHRREEAALRAAGLWFTTESGKTTLDKIGELLRKIDSASSRSPPMVDSTKKLPRFPGSTSILRSMITEASNFVESGTEESVQASMEDEWFRRRDRVPLEDMGEEIANPQGYTPDKVGRNDDIWGQDEELWGQQGDIFERNEDTSIRDEDPYK